MTRRDCVLVGTRPTEGNLGGYTEFPGGKCLSGELPAACAVRECFEETGLRVRLVRLLENRQYQYSHGWLDLHFFLCEAPPQPEPRGGFEWVSLSQLGEYRFPPANESVVAKLLSGSHD